MLELRNLIAGYGETDILRGVSLSLPRGELISLIGANGSGKSTLLKTAVGILPASSGKVIIDGVCAADLSRQELATRLSYLSQGKDLPDMTVEQMVLHGRFPYLHYPRRYRGIDRDMAAAAMAQMGITHWAARPLSSLSGGMRQKAYIAMALAQDTAYILLDEPTTYLDIAGQLELLGILRSLADSGKCVVAVLHDLSLAFSFSDKIAVLRDGKITACDTPATVCQSGIVRDVFHVSLCRDGDRYYYQYPSR